MSEDSPNETPAPIVRKSLLSELTRLISSWLASGIVHMSLLILLAWLTLPTEATDNLVNHLIASAEKESKEPFEQLEDEPVDEVELGPAADEVPEMGAAALDPTADIEPVDPTSSSAPEIRFDDSSFETAPLGDGESGLNPGVGKALRARRGKAKEDALAKYGGTKESEAAVAAALRWLAAHQMGDGGWSFAHHLAPSCRQACRNPGEQRFVSARNAATGLALLPFLGAGQTHREGKYKRVVQAGLYFLKSHQHPKSGSLWEHSGRMYSHGIASIALCEAYAMTRDQSLYIPAQKALNFIVYAQDPIGGGWRYDVQQPGDTSVLGWQLMALKSGHMAYLEVPAITVRKASFFLDSVESANGINYGYLGPGEGASTEATTAIGHLCRMYLGMPKTDPKLERGVRWLSKRGPNRNLYYDYYATQVLHHWEGEVWKKWNAVMRDRLVDSQARQGHERGSWFFPSENQTKSRHNEVGGRLYCTAMATMILEVYYRHMPIYAKESTEDNFPLE